MSDPKDPSVDGVRSTAAESPDVAAADALAHAEPTEVLPAATVVPGLPPAHLDPDYVPQAAPGSAVAGAGVGVPGGLPPVSTLPTPRRRRGVVVAGTLAGLFLLGAGLYAADLWFMQDRVPRGTTVAGTNIGGKSLAEASEILEGIAAQHNHLINISGGTASTQIGTESSGLSVDIPATIAAAGKPSYNPWQRLRGFGASRPVDIVSAVDETKFAAAIDYVREQLRREPVNGSVLLEAGQVVVTDSQPGQELDSAQAAQLLRTQWLSPGPLQLPVVELAPELPQQAVDAAAELARTKALAGDLVATGREGYQGTIPVARIGEVLSFVPEGAQLRPVTDVEKAQEILSEGLADSEVELRNARISFSAAGRVVTPHSDGIAVDWDKTMTDFEQRLLGSLDRTWPAVYKEEKATFTTADAEAARFDQQVSSFTTGGFSAASGVNIRRVAELVDGAIVAPGQTFSLNNYTGPRGTAQGFVESGIILNGHADTAVGGGISQFATTLYNAAYFAGMQDVAHTAHSYYISRYPAGREATVFEGAIDLQFKNTTNYPVLIRTAADSSSVTVAMYGVKTVQVESVNNGRWATTQPQPITLSGDKCVPSNGSPGFTTSDTRIISDLTGREISRETTTTVYDPAPIVRCQ